MTLTSMRDGRAPEKTACLPKTTRVASGALADALLLLPRECSDSQAEAGKRGLSVSM